MTLIISEDNEFICRANAVSAEIFSPIELSIDDIAKIEVFEAEAKAVLDLHGAQALNNRFFRVYPQAIKAVLKKDIDPLLKLIVMDRVAEG